MTEAMAERRTSKGIPIVDYDQLYDAYLARGIRLTDFHGTTQCFERWLHAKGLPEVDPEGIHFRSSTIYFARYLEDPEGHALEPLYVNFWHYLNELGQLLEWTEEEDCRWKRVPLTTRYGRHIPAAPSDAEWAAEGAERRRLGTVPDGEWDEFWSRYVENRRILRLQQIAAAEIAAEIANEHGVDVPEHGPMVMLEIVEAI